MKLNVWSVVSVGNPYTPPECKCTRLHGIVDKHPRLGENVEVTTSTIVKVEGKLVTTHSGSVYELGEPDAGYLRWLEKEGIQFDENNPIKLKEPEVTDGTVNKYMMATEAYLKSGNISRDEPDLCYIYGEDENNFIGKWIEGFGFFDVKFPKKTTRPLTEEEISRFSGGTLSINNDPSFCILKESDLRSKFTPENK